jgi:hypothetical protein
MQTSDHAPTGEVATSLTEEQAASELLKRWGTDDKSETSTEGEKPEASFKKPPIFGKPQKPAQSK